MKSRSTSPQSVTCINFSSDTRNTLLLTFSFIETWFLYVVHLILKVLIVLMQLPSAVLGLCGHSRLFLLFASAGDGT